MWPTLSCACSALSAEILSETGSIWYVQKNKGQWDPPELSPVMGSQDGGGGDMLEQQYSL